MGDVKGHRVAKFLFLVCLVLAFGAQAADKSEPRITGMFSSMRFGTEDLYGDEIFVVYSDTGYFAVVQCARGGVGRPMVAPAKVSGASIEFTLDEEGSCDARRFRGTVIGNKLSGRWGSDGAAVTLRRKSSYWQ